MGGRLDATNIVTPLLSLITNVSMDHEQYLGTTLAKVSTEKAGIIKQGVPVVSGVADDDSGMVIRRTCDERKAPLFLFGREFNGSFSKENKNFWEYHGLDGQVLVDLPMSLRGNYQVANASLAIAAAQLLRQQGWTVTEEQLRTGLRQTFWPGRLELFRLNKEGEQVDEKAKDGTFFSTEPIAVGVKALKHALRDFSRNRLILVWGR